MKQTEQVALTACLDAVGLLGPGLDGWENARAVLSGRVPHELAKTVIPPALCLPANERRRVGRSVRLALAAGTQAVLAGAADARHLATVFTSSSAEAYNCHEICETLASPVRQVSPTRFHNSVHNVAAGYWSIGMQATAPSNVLCAFDGSFAIGLLDALAHVQSSGQDCLLIAYDSEYPAPLYQCRPIPDAGAIALLFRAAADTRTDARTLARISVTLQAAATPPDTLPQATLETLRQTIPAFRGLPLLAALSSLPDLLASGNEKSHTVCLDYLEHTRLHVTLTPAGAGT